MPYFGFNIFNCVLSQQLGCLLYVLYSFRSVSVVYCYVQTTQKLNDLKPLFFAHNSGFSGSGIQSGHGAGGSSLLHDVWSLNWGGQRPGAWLS